jgi:hypothetical protein
LDAATLDAVLRQRGTALQLAAAGIRHDGLQRALLAVDAVRCTACAAYLFTSGALLIIFAAP